MNENVCPPIAIEETPANWAEKLNQLRDINFYSLTWLTPWKAVLVYEPHEYEGNCYNWKFVDACLVCNNVCEETTILQFEWLIQIIDLGTIWDFTVIWWYMDVTIWSEVCANIPFVLTTQNAFGWGWDSIVSDVVATSLWSGSYLGWWKVLWGNISNELNGNIVICWIPECSPVCNPESVYTTDTSYFNIITKLTDNLYQIEWNVTIWGIDYPAILTVLVTLGNVTVLSTSYASLVWHTTQISWLDVWFWFFTLTNSVTDPVWELVPLILPLYMNNIWMCVALPI